MQPPAPQPAPSPAALLDAYVAEWRSLKDWLSKAKARESELRTLIAGMMFGSIKQPNGCFPEGTSRQTVGGASANYAGKLDAKVNREILEELMVPTLTEAQLTAEEAKGLIRGKPELGLVAYKKLPPEKRVIIDKMIVVKPGAITLEVETLPK